MAAMRGTRRSDIVGRYIATGRLLILLLFVANVAVERIKTCVPTVF